MTVLFTKKITRNGNTTGVVVDHKNKTYKRAYTTRTNNNVHFRNVKAEDIKEMVQECERQGYTSLDSE